MSQRIHKESIVVDGLNGTFPDNFDEQFVSNLKAGGVTAIHVTVPDVEAFSVDYVFGELAKLFSKVRKLESHDVTFVTTAKEIRESKESGGVSVLLGSQGAGFLGLEVNNLELYYKLGMRIMQPTYQQRNQFGSGCGEKRDEGLSELGIQLVEKMNEIGMLICLSHVGYMTSMDVMKHSKHPVIFNHSNPKALCSHVRNITDDQIKACAEKGGVIGLVPVAMFMSDEKDPSELTLEDYVKHIDYVVNLVGVDHAAIGSDLAEGYSYTRDGILENRRLLPTLSSKSLRKKQDEFLASGKDRISHDELYMPPWIQKMSDMPKITEALSGSGYSDSEIKKILGENFLRVFEKVFGS